MRSKRSHEEWKQLVLNQKKSGEPVAVFCRNNNLKGSTFIYWIKKFEDKKEVKLIKITPRPELSSKPTLIMINNIKLEIPGDVSSDKITKIISVIREVL